MKFLFPLILILISIGCAKQAPRVTPTEPTVQQNLLGQVCEIEDRRHGESGDMDLYRNRYMDAYQADPGPPELLLEFFDATTTVACRGALAQLMCRSHPNYLASEWHNIKDRFTVQDRKALINGIRFAEEPALDKVALSLLLPENDVETRRKAGTLLTQVNQKRAMEDIAQRLESEQDLEALSNMLLALDMSGIPQFNEVLTKLFDHPAAGIHRTIMTNWSMSDFPDKKKYLANYRDNHSSQKVRDTAASFLATLEDREKMDMSVNMNIVGAKQHDDSIDPELLSAVKGYKVSRVKAMLNRGANANARDETQKTLLMHAATWGHERTLNELLAHGADINKQDENGRTALFYAAMSGSRNKTLTLLENGADQTVADNAEQTARDIAELMGFDRILGVLDEGTQAMAGKNPIHDAAARGNVAELEQLLVEGASVNLRDGNGRTPLMLAAQEGHISAVMLLISKGAMAGARDKSGMRASILAVSAGYETVFEYLKKQETAQSKALDLLAAAEDGDLVKVEKLLNEGADIETRNHLNYTVLTHAVSRGNLELVQLALSRGANMDQTIVEKPLTRFAREAGWVQIAEALEHHQNQINPNNRELIP